MPHAPRLPHLPPGSDQQYDDYTARLIKKHPLLLYSISPRKTNLIISVRLRSSYAPVSYTHLTLPTIYSV